MMPAVPAAATTAGRDRPPTSESPHDIADVVALRLSDISPADRLRWREFITARPESAPFVDEAWVTAWSTAFRPLQPLLLCARNRDGRLLGLGAVQGLLESWAGQRTRVLQSLTNVESVRYEFVAADNRSDIHEQLWRGLCQDRQWDVIRLEYLPEDSRSLSAGIRVAKELGWTHFLELTFESPWRSLPRPGIAWDDGLARKFKANLRNRERRLRALGEVKFCVERGDPAQPAARDVFYALEASGWKAERGTAIAQRSNVKAFYDGLLDQTADETWIPILTVAGQPIAAQLIRLGGGGRTLFLLKTAYDPSFAPYAPGQLLTAALVRYGSEHGMDALDFLAENMTWKQDWVPQLRGHYCLQLFAPTARGRYAYWSRYGVRESVKRIPGALRFVRWLRDRRKRES